MDENITVSDALEVFSLTPDFDMDMLKRAYRTVAMRVHPDKGGSPELFSTVNECFKVLCYEHNSRTGGALHDQLRRDFEADITKYDGMNRKDIRFNIQQFNSVFEETQLIDGIRSGGYGDWLRSDEEMPTYKIPKINPKTGADAFNRAFEASVPPPQNTETAIVVKPADLSCGSSLWLSELGVDAVDDFSMGDAYDCRLAHNPHRLADPKSMRFSSDHRAMTPAQVEAQRAADMSRGLSSIERDALDREEAKQRRFDEVRREREFTIQQRYAMAHAQANRILLGGPKGM